MEIFELRYFLAVAENENVHRASELLNVSTGSLSKAVARLEDELGISLFYKQGRNIRLTPEGLNLKKRAAHIVQLEEDAKVELGGGKKGILNVVISAEEILHTHFGLGLSQKVGKQFRNSRFQFLTRSESKVIQQVEDGEAHFGILTGEVPKHLASKILAKVEFKTCGASDHPIFKKFPRNAKIPVEQVLENAFVTPESSMLGRIATSTSLDGWRDDKFPRIIRYRANGLKIMERLVQKGLALAYLPDYYVEELDLVSLKVTGCPYTCLQTVKLICRDPQALGWMNRVWNEI